MKEEVWIDIPHKPPTKEADQTYVDITSKDGPWRLTDHFPLKAWAQGYIHHKWRGHVFCPKECREDIGKAAKEVLFSVFGISFNDQAIAQTNQN
jgi:hypothetical protein